MTIALLQQFPQLAALLPKDLSIDDLGAKLGQKPCQSTLAMVGLGALLFYMAEKDRNAKVEDVWDALEYCTSSLSVGYTDVYPQTPLGKIIGSTIMTLGPSMVTRMTAAPETARTPDPTQEEILATLRQIRDQLQRLEAKAP